MLDHRKRIQFFTVSAAQYG